MHRGAKHKNRSNGFDSLYDDITKIRAALIDATEDVKGIASKAVTHSLGDLKGKTNAFQDEIAAYALNKPFKTIGLTFLAGMFISYLIRK